MREKLYIKKISSFLPLFGLALLLLISPCKVRNYIQAELGIPQTKVLNKGQSTISQSNCQTFEVSEAVQAVLKPTFYQPGILIPESYSFKFVINLHKHSFSSVSSRNHSVSVVPLYILYHNLKVYS